MPTTIPTNQIPPGEIRAIEVDGTVLAVANVDGNFYAMDGTCPHAGGPLGEGFLKGCVVTCPWHGWQFDVTNGECTFSPDIVQDRYKCEIIGDELTISAETAAAP
jgi:nitrite reductase/ring-hydroxylating ferredoxin subunit